MNTLEVGPIVAELYDVVFYVYWIDEGNIKKTVEFKPDRTQDAYDDGFVSIFAADKIAGGAIVRLFCEYVSHFQWIKWSI